ncbi:unnamed protein product [Ectocarpus sp. 12 AP-2014]
MRFLDREHFSPHFFSEKRQGTVTGAVATLLGTLLGGGVLSLPFALRRSGIVFGAILLLLTSFATDFTVFTLVSCSRRSGGSSYESVADVAFGRRAKLLCMALVVCVTYLPLVGYTILLRDLLAPLAEVALNRTLGSPARNLLVSALVVLIYPACTLRTLTALRHLSFLSVLAVSLLTVFIGLRAGECAASVGVPASAVNLWPEDGWSGALQAIPIYICAFGCHFNVLPVHGELAKPTRERLHRLVHWTIGLVTAFYALVMTLGYTYGACTGGVSDNILNNFSTDDTLMNVGRVGLAVTLLVSFPLLTVPLIGTLVRAQRELVGEPCISLPQTSVRVWQHTQVPHLSSFFADGVERSIRHFNTSTCMASSLQLNNLIAPCRPCLSASLKGSMNRGPELTAAAGRQADMEEDIPYKTRAWLTLAILSSELLLAFNITMVTDVWGFLGSTANVMVAFTLPCAAYLKIRLHLPRRREKQGGPLYKKWVAGVLVTLSILAAVACTANNFYLLSARKQAGGAP